MSNFWPPARKTGWRSAAIPDKPEPYDISQPFDADRLMDGFTVEEQEHQVDPESPLGRSMAEARHAWAAPDYQPIDPDTWTVTPIPVEPDEETP